MVVHTLHATSPPKGASHIPGHIVSSSDTMESIRSMILKYDHKWTSSPVCPEVRDHSAKERIVVTGTTGAVGSYLLAGLLENDKVETVWAFNRKSKEGLMARQKASFEEKMLDVSLLESTKLVMLEGNLESVNFGLQEDVYHRIQMEATVIIHNAWAVHFNYTLQDFEPSIRGARILLDFAFSCPKPPRFLFSSSISSAGFGKPDRPLRDDYLEPEDVINGLGYGQGKLVTETLLRSARNAGLETCVMRLGQLCGDDKTGSWSKSDWIPAVIASSVSIKCLPAAIGEVSWLPLDIAAKLMVDASVAYGALLPPVINSLHPRPIKWAHIIALFGDVLKSREANSQEFLIVPFREWNKRVAYAASIAKSSNRDIHKRFPSTRIQHVVDRIMHWNEALKHAENGADAEAYTGTAKFDVDQAAQLSESLRDTPSLGKGHVEKWVSHWEMQGLFDFCGFDGSGSSPLLHVNSVVARARL